MENMDFFIPAAGSTTRDLGLRATYANGMEGVIIPADGFISTTLQGRGARHFTLSPTGRLSLLQGVGGVGKCVITARVDQLSALRFGVALTEPLFRDQLTLTVNGAHIEQSDAGYRAVVRGPADMTGHTAAWIGAQGGASEVPFRQDPQGQWFTEAAGGRRYAELHVINGQGIVVSRQEVAPPVVQPLASLPPAPQGQGAGRIIDIELWQIRNVEGNNPFQQEEPVRNVDGRPCPDGDCGQAGGADSGHCLGTYTMQPASGAPQSHRFASIQINPGTGRCVRVHEDGGSGSALIVQTPPDAEASDGVAFPDVLVGEWTVTDPLPDSAAGNGVLLTSNVPISITLRSTRGARVRVTLEILYRGDDEFDLHIIDFETL